AIRDGVVWARRQRCHPLGREFRAYRRLGMDVCVDAGVAGKMRLLMLFMLGLAPVCASAVAQKAGETTFPPEQIMAGAEIYATNCATCHGNRMKNPPSALELATVPKNDRRRC